MTAPGTSTGPVLFLVDTSPKNAMLEVPRPPYSEAHRPLGSDLPPERSPSAAGDYHLPGSPPLSPCEDEALRRPDWTSEPSCSARASLDDTHPTSATAAATATDDAPEHGGLTSHSPFHSFAHLAPSADDIDVGRASHLCGASGPRVSSHGECMGMDSQATSAPLGTVGSDPGPVSAGSAADALRRSTRSPSPAPASQGPRQPSREASWVRLTELSAPVQTPALPFEEDIAVAPAAVAPVPPPPPALRPLATGSHQQLATLVEGASFIEAFRPGESFGAHLVSPRLSLDSHPASRSSLDLLLSSPHTSAGPSSGRQSIESLTGMWTGKPSSIASRRSSGDRGTAAARLARLSGDGRATQRRPRFSAAAALQDPSNTQALRRALETLSLDPIAVGAMGGVADAGVTASPSFPALNADLAPPLASLRSLADSATSVTVVAQPKRPAGAGHWAMPGGGPSVGAMASALVDHSYLPAQAPPQAAQAVQHGSGGSVTSSGPSSGRSSPSRLRLSPRSGSAGSGGVAIPGGGGWPYGRPAPTGAPPPPVPALLDADLHDTFGAHAWYCGPSGTSPYSGTPPGSLALAAAAAGDDGAPGRHVGARGTAKLLELTSVAGQHSVTLHDSQCIVPSYDFLRQRRLVRAQQAEDPDASSGGYIAEAKRVLSEAMGAASRQEAEMRDSSYSGALGPLLRLMAGAAAEGDDAKTRASLHTLSLLVSNLPNREITAGLQGRRTLAAALRGCKALDVREQAVALLWDLDSGAGRDAAPALEVDDLFALTALLEETDSAVVASYALHLLDAACALPRRPKDAAVASEQGDEEGGPYRVELTAAQARELAERLTREACAHKHRLQDAAQYTLGSLLGALLSDPGLGAEAMAAALDRILAALAGCCEPGQCQVLLTVLSCLAGRPCLLAALARGSAARDAVLRCGQRAADPRLRARALSLIKVLNKEEHAVVASAAASRGGSSWYFGPGSPPKD